MNVMTQRHFDEELSDLKTKLLRMAGQAEDQIDKALTALVTRDSALARQVIERDHQVNALDVEIDEESIRLLALHQPAARDLRLVTTAMKIATELERISDLAENVCERAIELNEEPQLKPYIDIPMMGKMARMMVKQSIDAFVKDDAALARKVLTDDDFVDDLMEQLFRELLSFMLEDTRTISRAIRLSFIAKYLERMADTDPSNAENGGELGYFSKGTMVEEFENIAFSMNVGEISDPVKTDYGYHLIHLTDKKEAKEANFEDHKEEIKQTLFDQKISTLYSTWITEQREKLEIESTLVKE